MNNNEHPAEVMKSFSNKDTKKRSLVMILVGVVVVLSGIFAGWMLSGGKIGAQKTDSNMIKTENTVNNPDEAGVADESTFKNSESPIGILQEGGTANGVGNYHLERPGGISQNVYLTSTVIDLKSFVGKKVQVWGETLSAPKAGWLMDVGKIKVVK